MAREPVEQPQELDTVRARQGSRSPYNLIVLVVSLLLAVMAAIFLYVLFYR